MRANPFAVHVTTLRKVPGSAMDVVREGPIPGLVVGDAAVPEDAVLSVAAEVAWASGDGFVVTADVAAPWVGTCRRCLGEARGEVRTHVREVYEEGSDGEETYALRGDEVDLTPLVRDAVLLGLPAAPLCKEGCEGLCPTCGADRNEGSCGCDEQPRDPRWAGLDALRGDGSHS